jgi:hypothetical protein
LVEIGLAVLFRGPFANGDVARLARRAFAAGTVDLEMLLLVSLENIVKLK